ncbi:peroxidase 5-like [Fagus crenata]
MPLSYLIQHQDDAEKDSLANNPSLRGFEVIYEAKAELEAQCPQTVSCADILAFAARDSVCELGGISYKVPSGRRDGISLIEEATKKNNIPPPTLDAKELEENFAQKGLTLDEMVTGTHSIGISHCTSFKERLYNFSETQLQNPSMDPIFARDLKTKCPQTATRILNDPTVPLDVVTPNRLDINYYENLKKHHGLLTSDQTLLSSPSTAIIVKNGLRSWHRNLRVMVPVGLKPATFGS